MKRWLSCRNGDLNRPRTAAPVYLTELELDRPSTSLDCPERYRSARVLVRRHGQPLGEVEVPLEQGRLTSHEFDLAARQRLSGAIEEHCATEQLALDQHGALDRHGAADTRATEPPCRAAFRQAYARGLPISVVIATRDRSASLLRSLDSLAELDYPAFDVVVVDSAPADDATACALQSRAWPFALTYLRSGRPGLALAHNAGLAAVTGDVVALTDDDVVVDRDWLTWLATAFLEPDVLGVTGLILPAELETEAQLRLEQTGGFGRGFHRRRFSLAEPDSSALFPFAAGRFGSGANMAFRTDRLRRRGGFDPATGAGTPARGGDDLLAFLDVLLDGGVLSYQPAALVRHYHHRQPDALRRQAFSYGIGTGAYLAAAVREHPRSALGMARRFPAGVRQFVRPAAAPDGSEGGSAGVLAGVRPEVRTGLPLDLLWRKCAGLLLGPGAYVLSRGRDRRATFSSTSFETFPVTTEHVRRPGAGSPSAGYGLAR